VAALLIAGGGFLLYRHTAAFQDSSVATAEPQGRTETRGPSAAPAGPALPKGGEVRRAAPGRIGADQGAEGLAPGRRPLPQAPFGESEEVFETGAKVYVAHCASCHGQPGRPTRENSDAVAFWDAHSAALPRVAAQAPGTTYLQIADGVAAANGRPAMPGYRHVLSETEMWDLVLLLRNAGQELPDPVLRLLRRARP